jgi:uncharacterized repeat protein (TIGR01451 family)
MANQVLKRKLFLFKMLLLLVLVSLAVNGLTGAQAAPGSVHRPQRGAMHTFHPNFVIRAYGINSTLSVLNRADLPAVFVINLYDLAGNIVYNYAGMINPRASVLIDAATLPGDLHGVYSFVVSSDQPVESAVNIYRPNGNLLSIYRGLNESGANSYVIGPLYNTSSGVIQNTSPSTAFVTIQFYDLAGMPAGVLNHSLASGSAFSFLVSSIPELPLSFAGMAVVSSDQSIIGLTVQRVQRPTGLTVNSMNNIMQPATSGFIPRLLKGMDEGGGPRSSHIFVSNLNAAATVTLHFLDSAGAEVTSQVIDLGTNQSQILALDSLAGLGEGQIYALRMESTSPVAMSEITDFQVVSPTHSAAAIPAGPDTSTGLPRMLLTSDSYTILSVQNTGSSEAEVAITFNQPDGSQVASRNPSIKPGGWARYDLRDLAGELGSSFTGTASLTSNQIIQAIADEFYKPCSGISNVSLDRLPAGEVFTGNNVQFTASAGGTAPFMYAWTLDGELVDGVSVGQWEHQFNLVGDTSVDVTVTNACGTANASAIISVQAPAVNQPDLSTSNLTPSLASISVGSTLTYTAVLRNTGTVAADASLASPLPTGTAYVNDSASASDGGPVTFENNTLSWSGSIEPGSPVFISYTVLVLSTSGSSTLVHQASLNDGLGNDFPLVAESSIVTSYSLLIDGGAISTNQDLVSLGYAWDNGADIVYFNVSNDPSFDPGPNTSGWLAVNAAHPTLDNWSLNVTGDMRMPYTVYIRLRSRDGLEFGPFQDDIIYDPVAPVITQASVLPPGGLQARANSLDYYISVNASDLVSGVKELQTSSTADFAIIDQHIAALSLTTEFTWQPASRATLFVRAVDRSGNLSPVRAIFDKVIFMPSLRR